MTIKELFGRRIKDLRVKQNLKQAQLAEIVGIDPKHQSCIENGKNFPSTDLIERYAKAFEIESSDLLNFNYCAPKLELIDKIYKMVNEASEEDIKIIYKICLAVLK